jgi:hypothetical protein
MWYNNFYEKCLFLENKKQAMVMVQKGSLSQEDLDNIINADPSPTKKYTGWLAKQWVQGNVQDIDTLRNNIEEFDAFEKRGKTTKKDIYQYANFKELEDEVHRLNNSVEGMSNKDLQEDYEVVRDDENLFVAVPHTHEASRKLGLSKFAYRKCEQGKDSAWCTTYKAPDHFNDYYYKNNVTFYYILVKSEKIRNELKQNGFGPQFTVAAIAVLSDDMSNRARSKGYDNMDGYDGLDKQFKGKKLANYLEIIGLK